MHKRYVYKAAQTTNGSSLKYVNFSFYVPWFAWSTKQNVSVSTVPCCFKRSHWKLCCLQWFIGEISFELFFLDQKWSFHSCNLLKIKEVSWEWSFPGKQQASQRMNSWAACFVDPPISSLVIPCLPNYKVSTAFLGVGGWGC